MKPSTHVSTAHACRRDLHSLRDLDASHLPLLHNLKAKCQKVCVCTHKLLSASVCLTCAADRSAASCCAEHICCPTTVQPLLQSMQQGMPSCCKCVEHQHTLFMLHAAMLSSSAYTSRGMHITLPSKCEDAARSLRSWCCYVCMQAVLERYGVDSHQLRMFLHYPPSCASLCCPICIHLLKGCLFC